MNPPAPIENSVIDIIPSGFNFDIVAYDNTQIHQLDLPLEFTFEFDNYIISQMEFLQMRLYYWQPGNGWVPAVSVCQQQFFLENYDLFEFTLQTALCFTGQYQFFQISPDPAHSVVQTQFLSNPRFVYDDLNVYYPSQGIGGIRGVEPPQPHFTGKPIELPTQTSSSSSSISTSYTQQSDSETIDILTDFSFAPSSRYSFTPVENDPFNSPSSSSSSSSQRYQNSGIGRLSASYFFTITFTVIVMFIL